MTIDVCAAVIFSAGKLLLTSRPEGTHCAGLWELPGGKMEFEETKAQCVKRELREELACELAVYDTMWTTIYCYPEKKVKIYFVRAVLKSPAEELKPLEQQLFRFVPVEDLEGFDIIPADRDFIEFLRQRQKFF